MMGTKTRPARIKRVSARRFRIVLKEGKNRQIRRMVRKVGHQITRLKRVRVANIRLGRLAEGSWRYLSEREKEVLQLLTTGLSNPQIAQELFIAKSTVRSHIKSIYGKLNVHRRWDAIQRAQELGLL